METEQVVEIYTDGACRGNPGPGGWGAVLRCGGRERELYGGEPGPTTSNRMELMAPIQAVRALTRPCAVRVFSDSRYLTDGMGVSVPRWKANGWLAKGNRPVPNADLWRLLDDVVAPHRVEWRWVKGHSGIPENERADRLAGRGVREVTGARVSRRAAGKRAPVPRSAVLVQRRCSAITKAGRPCPIEAGPGGLCHVHDPVLQCRAARKNGKPCAVATGGGRCARHRDAAVVLELFSG